MTTSLLRNVSAETLMGELSRFQAEGGADPTVRRLAELAVWQKDDQIAGIYDFVKNTFPYLPDPIHYEFFIHPRLMAENYFAGYIRGADCDDHALLASAMLRSLGYEAKVLLVDSAGNGEIDHALAQVNTPIGWVNVDTVANCPLGWQFNYRIAVPV